MTAIAIALLGAGLFGGIALLTSGSKKITPITFPSTFYKDLQYFKKEGNTIIAIMEDADNEILFKGNDKKASEYFAQVQLGFEEWLKDNDHFTQSDSTVKFS